MLEKLCEAKLFSADILDKTLLYTTINGDLLTIESHAKDSYIVNSSSLKRYGKFYPADTAVITITDQSGLSIIDRNKKREIYKYKNESLYAHGYSDTRILGTFDDYNIKFYDLRCRYLVNSITNSSFKNKSSQVEWINECIYIYDGGLKIFDSRNNNKLKSIDDVNCFGVTNGNCYFTKKDPNLMLYQIKNESVIKKLTEYENFIASRNGLFGLMNNTLIYENEHKSVKIPLENIDIITILFGEDSGWIFDNDFLYKVDHNINDFIEKYRTQ